MMSQIDKIVAFQMDALDSININGDSTFVLMLEAQQRGYKLFHYTPDMLSYNHHALYAKGAFVHVQKQQGNHFSIIEETNLDLAKNCDVIWLRQDPPFDMSYITTTHLLEMISNEVLVVNNPASVRNAPEKLIACAFHDLMPPTLISRDSEAIKQFRTKYQDIIIKPLFGNGGAGVFHVKPDDENLSSLCELFFDRSNEPVMVQQYISAVKNGDKRVILCDGAPIAAINRVPPAGEARSNMHVGGVAGKSQLTARDKEICDRIGDYLKSNGLLFVGIDIIGDYLTEINVTSPTGLQEANHFDNKQYQSVIWDAIDRKLAVR